MKRSLQETKGVTPSRCASKSAMLQTPIRQIIVCFFGGIFEAPDTYTNLLIALKPFLEQIGQLQTENVHVNVATIMFHQISRVYLHV